ncbi:pyruvate dehydrogenase E1 component subunit alpha-3, chloroplastic-like protein, partial [Tanacetum coccineum]
MFSAEHHLLGGFAFMEKIGTANNGQFFECLNMAALWKLPIIFVVENNLWAIVHVDGMDVLKVREVAKRSYRKCLEEVRALCWFECETYRFRGHSLADPDELRDPGVRDEIDDGCGGCLLSLADASEATSEASCLENVYAVSKRLCDGTDGRRSANMTSIVTSRETLRETLKGMRLTVALTSLSTTELTVVTGFLDLKT